MSFKKKTKIVLFADCGEHKIINSDPQMPEKGGTGKNGNVKRANCFILRLSNPSNDVTIDGVVIVDGATVRAKVKKPGQNMNNWIINNG